MTSKIFLIVLIFVTFSQIGIFVEGTGCFYSNSNNNYKHLVKYTCSVISDYSDGIIEHYGGRHIPRKYDGDVQVISHSYGLNDVNLGTFTNTYCDRFKNLENITFMDAKIQRLSPNGFKNCKNLEILNLDYNEIKKIPENLLIENKNLKSFYISSNELTTLHVDTFKSQENLKRLDLSRNRINYLPRNIFKSLKNLDCLSLGNNQLTTLDHAWFQPLRNLKTLHLYSNGIRDLPRGIFSYFDGLWSLALEFNNLSEIHRSSFGNLHDLENIFLNNNQINAVDKDFIDRLSAIRQFDFSNNFCSSFLFNSTRRYHVILRENLERCEQNRPRESGIDAFIYNF